MLYKFTKYMNTDRQGYAKTKSMEIKYMLNICERKVKEKDATPQRGWLCQKD